MEYYFDALEFNLLIPIIEKYIKTYPGNKELQAIKRVLPAEAARQELILTEQMAQLLKFDSSISFEELSDIGESLEYSSINGFALGTDEILEIKKSIVILKDIEASLAPYSEKYPGLNSLLMGRRTAAA